MRWLERYLTEGSPRLQHFADITASLASRGGRNCGALERSESLA